MQGRTTPNLTQYPLAFPECCNIFYGVDANGKMQTFHPSGEIALQLISEIDTLRAKATEILGSTKPLNLESLRHLDQRWDSPQALTLGMPYPSCIESSSALGGYATLVATAVQVLFSLKLFVSKF